MARSKETATVEERNHAKDLGLQRKFGITLADRDARAENQNNLCAICGGPLAAHGHPCTDHYHFKIKVVRETCANLIAMKLKWHAHSYDERGQELFVRHANTQAAARAAVKAVTMPWSVRGLLCGKCNYGLGMVERFFDAAAHPENLSPVIAYLQNRLDNPPVL